MKTLRLSRRKSEKITIKHMWNVVEALHNPDDIYLKAKETCKCHLLLIVRMNCNLVVNQVSIHKAKITLTYKGK